MIRLIGFLVGSAVSIGMLLLILGIPDITLSREVIEQIDFDDVIEQIDLDSVPATAEAVIASIEAIGNNMADEISEIVEQLETEEAPTEQASFQGARLRDRPLPGKSTRRQIPITPSPSAIPKRHGRYPNTSHSYHGDAQFRFAPVSKARALKTGLRSFRQPSIDGNRISIGRPFMSKTFTRR